MSKLINLTTSTLLSGGIINNGNINEYINDSARRTLGMGISQLEDGQVHYFSKNKEILKRAAIQVASQTAYGLLRSYPRYIKFWEQKERDKYLQSQSQSIVNKGSLYYQLIKEQQVVAREKNYCDSIVGSIVHDYLELSISPQGNYYNSEKGTIESNREYGSITFVDLQPQIQVGSRNNIIQTVVQGRDYSRKEYISGGDLEVTISGKITSKYPDLYPEAEISKFLKLMQFKGVIDCDNTILRQFKISQLIILNYSFLPSEYRNIQNYSLSCVAVEPSESVEIKIAEQKKAEEAIKHTNKWIKLVKFGVDTVNPSSLLKITKSWL